MLSGDDTALLDEVIQSGILPTLVECLTKDDKWVYIVKERQVYFYSRITVHCVLERYVVTMETFYISCMLEIMMLL